MTKRAQIKRQIESENIDWSYIDKGAQINVYPYLRISTDPILTKRAQIKGCMV